MKVLPAEIKFFSSDKNYVTLHLKGNRKVVVRSTITEMQGKLDPDKFFKVNRSRVLNHYYITKIDTETVYINNHPITINKAQWKVLIQLLDKH